MWPMGNPPRGPPACESGSAAAGPARSSRDFLPLKPGTGSVYLLLALPVELPAET